MSDRKPIPPKTAALIVAAGEGRRAGGAMPKQWRRIGGRSVTEWTVRAFDRHPDIDLLLVMVHAESDPGLWPSETQLPCLVATGGASRAQTVQNGLHLLDEMQVERVLIHDVARPGIDQATISAVLTALDTHAGAAPALPVTDALWRGESAKGQETPHVSGTVSRDKLWRAQTPQGFDLQAIKAGHEAFEGEPADDVEVARAAGIEVAIVPGSEANLKITHPEDFARAAAVLLGDQMDIRVGNGFDVHRFGEGDHVILCGIKIPHSRGLQGHSDADVALHTVTDAIYGALAKGDIGQHFPPSDPQWKGASSDIFLTHAVQLAASDGFTISNADLTLICERPKIGPVAPEMRAALANLLGIEIGRVSVKATTSERLGFTGREEGIAALASVTLVRA